MSTRIIYHTPIDDENQLLHQNNWVRESTCEINIWKKWIGRDASIPEINWIINVSDDA